MISKSCAKKSIAWYSKGYCKMKHHGWSKSVYNQNLYNIIFHLYNNVSSYENYVLKIMLASHRMQNLKQQFFFIFLSFSYHSNKLCHKLLFYKVKICLLKKNSKWDCSNPWNMCLIFSDLTKTIYFCINSKIKFNLLNECWKNKFQKYESSPVLCYMSWNCLPSYVNKLVFKKMFAKVVTIFLTYQSWYVIPVVPSHCSGDHKRSVSSLEVLPKNLKSNYLKHFMLKNKLWLWVWGVFWQFYCQVLRKHLKVGKHCVTQLSGTTTST